MLAATVFVSYGSHAVIAVGGWCAGDTTDVHLAVDWSALGLEPSSSHVAAPAIDSVQSKQSVTVASDGSISMAMPSKGIILVVNKA